VVRHPADRCEIKGCTHLFEDCNTARSRRTMTIPLVGEEALNIYRKSVESVGTAKILIFPGEHGAPSDYRTLVRLHFDLYRKAAKLPMCTPYVLRHSRISGLLAHGISVVGVRQRAGHASVTMALNTYAHVIVGGSDRLAKALERYA
jgi:integrase